MIGGLLKTTTAGGWPNARIGRGRRVYVGDSRDTLEQLLEGLQEGDTVDALLKGRLEEVSNTPSGHLGDPRRRRYGARGLVRGTHQRYGLTSTRE
jgi:hypothetical protein